MQEAIRKTLVTAGALGAVAAGSAAIAGAASNGGGGAQQQTTPAAQYGPSTQRSQRQPGETALTGETATKVKEAAQAKVPGGTVLRVETDADRGAAYEAHVRKSDGSEVVVLVDKQFKVVAVRDCGGRGGRGPRGDGSGRPRAQRRPAG